jgi:hypothetical protein
MTVSIQVTGITDGIIGKPNDVTVFALPEEQFRTEEVIAQSVAGGEITTWKRNDTD